MSDPLTDSSTVRVPLWGKDDFIRGYALIDEGDATFVNQFRWYLDAHGYAARGTWGHIVLLHREILGLCPGDGMAGDHINRDKLDDRRSNLRAIPKNANQQNVPSHGSTSVHRGVSWDTERQKWLAQICVNYKRIKLGRFATEAAAADAAQAARLRLFPFAVD